MYQVTFVLDHELCTFNQILEHIKKAPSTLSWHLKRLSKATIISVTYGREYQLYQVLNSKFEKILCKYGERALEPELQTDTTRYLKGFNTMKYLGSGDLQFELPRS